eukprot:TRINITY_DN71974_c0_g1_i1.p1 TRINITY_DN71974_c0_g1~~TRINITY_DN71974_c0_g1_i1.p1  ORF type:complete len:269 (+),score=119.74 TRINITY_DN71974_c0_g1_i1:85-807(+)
MRPAASAGRRALRATQARCFSRTAPCLQGVEATLQIMRFDPATNTQRIDSFKYEKRTEYMVLDLLVAVKAHQDPSLAFRASCCEGVCGSCAMNINGINSLACITYAPVRTAVGPLPNFPVLKDLVVDIKNYFKQYEFIRPYTRQTNKKRFHIQSIYQRYKQQAALLYGENPKAIEESSRVPYKWRGFNVPTKAAVYFQLLDRCIAGQDQAGAVKVLEQMKAEGISLDKKVADGVAKAIAA